MPSPSWGLSYDVAIMLNAFIWTSFIDQPIISAMNRIFYCGQNDKFMRFHKGIRSFPKSVTSEQFNGQETESFIVDKMINYWDIAKEYGDSPKV